MIKERNAYCTPHIKKQVQEISPLKEIKDKKQKGNIKKTGTMYFDIITIKQKIKIKGKMLPNSKLLKSHLTGFRVRAEISVVVVLSGPRRWRTEDDAFPPRSGYEDMSHPRLQDTYLLPAFLGESGEVM